MGPLPRTPGLLPQGPVKAALLLGISEEGFLGSEAGGNAEFLADGTADADQRDGTELGDDSLETSWCEEGRDIELPLDLLLDAVGDLPSPSPGPQLLLARGGSGHNVVVVPGSSVPVAGSHGSLPPVPQSSGRDAQLPGDLDWTDTRLRDLIVSDIFNINSIFIV